MKFLRNFLDRQQPRFKAGGKFEKYYALYEMLDTFLYTPGEVTKESTHVKDSLDLKRMMITVVVALVPCIIFAMYNAGMQANLALASLGQQTASGWQGNVLALLGVGIDPQSFWASLVHGALYFFPLLIVSYTVGGVWESLFAMVRGHEINEGFLVTGILFPLILPPTIPLWQAALGISFGVVVGKEVFGGVGKNFLNPALTGRAFLFFAYPAQISGDAVWVAVDGFSGATPLSIGYAGGQAAIEKAVSWTDAFLGMIPGSMGETSTLACMFGAFVLIASGIGSWRIMVSVLIGAGCLAFLFNAVGSSTNAMFSITPGWHFVLGGFAFGLVFMATDPVSASMTKTGQWIYGLLIGCMVILIRVVNEAFPEGMMLAILFGNVWAPVIDHYVVKANIKRRVLRNG
ncbi:MAG: NADH:ubiquinone reductase (Na(+)-transporting) subunit B [Deltaproteobacteria bacterium]|mgnify:CR=1 FL=1|jgi:Na+-transporting NADH:ubiquinone oxidoreductase subunit B|nr:NADH:ubiquinone reductase (Na(+)-transporting) subunit B [Deltaproteobacteria bacterium]MBT4088680.1 NADH:ubiquinone reductase (Na(+)-transporting) subunit B [Deltaproteobacteria bacterium]MBT4263952.1 NADH:ubiquinone reductase (Na(+)-transporting) subunit B [Deltaproteobacteria bacterium]MBT4639895.1 NADH:ubiquinone reductase (Na(+)-transporting) subunit B [Deltaproteobacteria bacterium]MBT6498507.1 NADH:ubiquinone reductase (Na(+)-transporting) subunit B [Deltaproteobacteria bacterium]